MRKTGKETRLKEYFEGNWFLEKMIFNNDEKLYGVANGIYSIISSTEYKLETLIKGPKKDFKIETYAKRPTRFASAGGLMR